MALTKSMRLFTVITLATLGIALGGSPAQTPSSDNLLIRTADGPVQGSAAWNGTRAFLGIPYAAPPVGPLRWKPPQRPVERNAVFAATHFGHRCIQFADYPDMVFRDAGPSEDCLTLNIWAPAHTTGTAKLPVMVWIHGGGFVGGGSSEPRQDGAILAARGVVVVSMNYRLGMLGFFVHPALTAESPHHAAGNYGLMDQAAALAWVHANIGAFGGDPENITLFGESAGSFSVSALMASPLATDRIAKAIGESGAAFFNRTLPFAPLAEREMTDPALAKSILGTGDLAALRAMPAEMLAAKAALRSDKAFPPDIDGYVLTAPLPQIYAAGRQAHIPLLAGWNADEPSASHP
jgi:para-nitrobenzyl esterase